MCIRDSNYTFVHAALSIGDTREILDLTWDHRARWRLIGIELGIDAGTLDAIEVDNRKVDGCLVEMISKWLHGDQRLPKPTRSAMHLALQSLGVPSPTSLTEVSQATNRSKPLLTWDTASKYFSTIFFLISTR